MVAPGSSGPTTAVSSGLDENATPAASLAAPLRPGAITHCDAMFTPAHTCLKLTFAHTKESVQNLLSNRTIKKFLPLAALLLIVVAVFAARKFSDSSPARSVNDIPVAFWAWQTETPSGSDIQQTIDYSGARLLFLRTGQIDYENGQAKRIRAVRGSMPRGIELHLVYNATRDLMLTFEKLTPDEIASAITDA